MTVQFCRILSNKASMSVRVCIILCIIQAYFLTNSLHLRIYHTILCEVPKVPRVYYVDGFSNADIRASNADTFAFSA